MYTRKKTTRNTMRILQTFGSGLLLLSIQFLPLLVEAQVKNPITACQDIGGCIAVLVKWILGLVAVVAVAFVVYGGFLYITAGGNDDQIKQGKQAVVGAVVGIIVVGLAYAIVEFVARALGASGGGAGGQIVR
jgi:type IV secretion system pilin